MSGAAVADAPLEPVDALAGIGVRAFTTTRAAGTFGTAGIDPVHEVSARWTRLQEALAGDGPRFASATQVHGRRVVLHETGWEGWLRVPGADGHLSIARGTGMAVTIADCVPVFLAHPAGAVALLHSGWRGTAGRIVDAALDLFTRHGLAARDVHVHLGPAICGSCYEVSPDVYAELTGRRVGGATPVDLRALIADQARAAGVRHISTSPWCTRCHNDRFFSHRAGDAGRQLGVMIAPSG